MFRQPPDLAGSFDSLELGRFPVWLGLFLFVHDWAHQYFRGRATPAGAGKLYSTTSTPLAVSLANHVSLSSPSSSTSRRSRRYESSRRIPFIESESFISTSTRQIICSETAIGRPASITRSTRHRASSRRFCSRSIPSGIQPFLYVRDLFAHLLTHRIELGVERAAESDPVLAPHIFERHRRAKFEQRAFYLLPSLGIALSHGAMAIEHRLDRCDIDSNHRYED